MANARRDCSSDAILVLPGIMGSELLDAQGRVVWGFSLELVARQTVLGKALRRLALPSDLSNDGVHPGRLIRLPVHLPLLTSAEPYTRLCARLKQFSLRPEAVREYPYDWRRSIREAAAALVDVAAAHLANWKRVWERLPPAETRHLPEPMLTLVCHSMGGLVARWFAEIGQGREIVRQIITLGTPFSGSLNAIRILATGEYLPFGIYAEALRDTGRTMPGLYELVAQYRCVSNRVDDSPRLRPILPSDLGSVGADPELAAEAFATHRLLKDAVLSAGSKSCPIVPLVGVRQPTLQSIKFALGSAEFEENLDGIDHQGDGTVYRYSAAPRGTQPMPLPQTHGSLAKSREAIAFVEAKLTERNLGEVQAPAGVGVRLPSAVTPGQPFPVELTNDWAEATCRVTNAETNVQVAVALITGKTTTKLSVPSGGVYRVSVAGGGYSPVETLITAFWD